MSDQPAVRRTSGGGNSWYKQYQQQLISVGSGRKVSNVSVDEDDSPDVFTEEHVDNNHNTVKHRDQSMDDNFFSSHQYSPTSEILETSHVTDSRAAVHAPCAKDSYDSNLELHLLMGNRPNSGPFSVGATISDGNLSEERKEIGLLDEPTKKQDPLAAESTRRLSSQDFLVSRDYEEYKPPKKYVKPAEKVKTSSTSLYITGASPDKCKRCGRKIYEMEKLLADHACYHKQCFRCHKCQAVLRLGSYISIDGLPHCKSHTAEIVQRPRISSVGDPIRASEFARDTKPPAGGLGRSISSSATNTSLTKKLSNQETMTLATNYVPHSEDEQDDLVAITNAFKKFQALEKEKDVKTTPELNASKKTVPDRSPPVNSTKTTETFNSRVAQNEMCNDAVRLTNGDSHRSPTHGHVSNHNDELIIEPVKTEPRFKATNGLHSNITDDVFDGPNITNYSSAERSETIENSIDMSNALVKFRQMENKQETSKPRGEYRRTTPRIELAIERQRKTNETADLQQKPMTINIKVQDSDRDKSVDLADGQKDWKEAKRATVTATVNQNSAPVNGHERKITGHNNDHNNPVVNNSSHASNNEELPSETTQDLFHKWKMWEQAFLLSEDNIKNRRSVAKSKQQQQIAARTHHKHKTVDFDGATEGMVSRNKVSDVHIQPVVERSSYVPTTLAFTRSKLALFKKMEEKALAERAVPNRTSKKSFRWDVKEIVPLHRPGTSPGLDVSASYTFDHYDSPSALPDVVSSQHDANRDDYPSLEDMKTILRQFRAMEDATRPPPSPIVTSLHRATPTTVYGQQPSFNHQNGFTNDTSVESMNYF